MAYTAKFAEDIGYIDVINSQSVTNTNANSIGVNMANFRRAAFIVTPTNVGAAGTVDGRLQCSTTSNFASVTNLAGTNLAQMTINNLPQITEVRADQVAQALGVSTGNLYVRLQLTCGGNPVTVGAIGLGKDPVQRPASQYNLNTSYLMAEQSASI